MNKLRYAMRVTMKYLETMQIEQKSIIRTKDNLYLATFIDGTSEISVEYIDEDNIMYIGCYDTSTYGIISITITPKDFIVDVDDNSRINQRFILYLLNLANSKGMV